jgi:hypothetical protein
MAPKYIQIMKRGVTKVMNWKCTCSCLTFTIPFSFTKNPFGEVHKNNVRIGVELSLVFTVVEPGSYGQFTVVIRVHEGKWLDDISEWAVSNT